MALTKWTRASRASAHGFTYLGLLILVAVIATATAATLHLGVAAQRRVAEQDLLACGQRFAQALDSYASATVRGQDTAPKQLEDLLHDPRFPDKVVRHLRRIEPDPVTGETRWGVVRDDDTHGIVGVYSLSNQLPTKISDFPSPWSSFSGARSYREWVFEASMAP